MCTISLCLFIDCRASLSQEGEQVITPLSADLAATATLAPSPSKTRTLRRVDDWLLVILSLDSDANARVTISTTGESEIDYRIGDEFAIGAKGEYSHTWTPRPASTRVDMSMSIAVGAACTRPGSSAR
jgi:hypothetical protein